MYSVELKLESGSYFEYDQLETFNDMYSVVEEYRKHGKGLIRVYFEMKLIHEIEVQ
jgi:hypothetical protein